MGMRMRVRSVSAGAIYHVYTRGVLRNPIFADDQDRQQFLRLLALTADQLRVEVRSFCLMGNHVHLHLKTLLANLPAAMQLLLGAYARHFNERHERSGHVFESRYFSPLVEPGYFEARLTRYIHRNPVAAGMVSSPDEWAWSSCKAYLGLVGCPSWLVPGPVLETLGGTAAEALTNYRGFLGIDAEDMDSVTMPTFERPVAIGSQEFRAQHGDTDDESERDQNETGLKTPLETARRVPPERVIAVISEMLRYPELTLTPTERPPHPARYAAALVLGALGNWSQRQIGAMLGGVTVRTVGRYIAAGRGLYAVDSEFRRTVTRCLRLLGRTVPDDLQPAAWPGYLAGR